MKKETIENHTLGDLKCEWTHRTEPGKEAGWHIFNSQTLITIGDGEQAGINANFICHAVNNYEMLVKSLFSIAEHEGELLDDSDAKGFVQMAKRALKLLEEGGETA